MTESSDRSLTIGPLTRTDFVRFAGAGGDFNPLHHDDTYARAQGYPSVFAMGMLTASLGSRLLTDWFGLAALRSYQVRFMEPVWPNQTLLITGRVTRHEDRETECVACVDLTIAGDHGDIKMTATACCAVPRPQ